MSRRKNKNIKNKQAGQSSNNRDGQSGELLSELNNLRNLLGSDDISDIPLLDQVAGTSAERKPASPLKPQSRPRQPAPALLDDTLLNVSLLDEIDPPVLFSPVDEFPPDEQPELSTQLSESDRALLQPLQNLPAEKPEGREISAQKQQEDLFEQAAATESNTGENPFLPSHIRARLTGGQVPRAELEEQTSESAREREPSANPGKEPSANPDKEPSANPDKEPSANPDKEPPAQLAEELSAQPAEECEAAPEPAENTSTEERQRLRHQLIDRLVAKELPELERRLRARIELMVDELDDWH